MTKRMIWNISNSKKGKMGNQNPRRKVMDLSEGEAFSGLGREGKGENEK